MSVTVTVTITSGAPASGWKVQYRKKNTTGAWLIPDTPAAPPYFVSPFSFTTIDPAGTMYEVQVQSDCGGVSGTSGWLSDTTPCNCDEAGGGEGGWNPTKDSSQCIKLDTIPANVTSTTLFVKNTGGGIGKTVFTAYETRVYATGFTDADMYTLVGVSNSKIVNVFKPSTSKPEWINNLANTYDGPMNEQLFWRSNDGISKALIPVTNVFTIDCNWTNTDSSRKFMYIGVGCKGEFRIKVNGKTLVNTYAITAFGDDRDTYLYKIWHIMPFPVVIGGNYFNIEFSGTGSTGVIDDGIGIVIYDTNLAAIQASSQQSDLARLWDVQHIIAGSGHPIEYDVTTCVEGRSLDRSSGNPMCSVVLHDICNGTVPQAPITEDCTFTKDYRWADTTYHLHTPVLLNFGSSTSVKLHYQCNDRPNRIRIIDTGTDGSGSTLVGSTYDTAGNVNGWVGNADYSGLWGAYPPGVHTSISGDIIFTPVVGHIYRLEVEVGGAAPAIGEDSCLVYFVCTSLATATFRYIPVRNGDYSNEGARIYSPRWITSSLPAKAAALFIGLHGYDPDGFVDAYLDTPAHQWKSLEDNSTPFDNCYGPMNRSAVWIDNEPYDGIADAPPGSTVSASISYDNTRGTNVQMYLGVGGDNQWVLSQNDTKLVATVDSERATDDRWKGFQYRYWHIIPVNIVRGLNTFTLEVTNSTSSGNNPAAIAMTLYDNSLAEMKLGTGGPGIGYNIGLNIVADTIFLT